MGRMSAGQLHYQVREGTAIITIDNPGKRNAMTPDMWRAWPGLMRRATEDEGVRAVVITGAAGTFCAGADIVQLDSIHDSTLPVETDQAIASCPKPTIAAINGSCVGGGVQVIAACDIRLSGLSARFGITPANLGIIYPALSLQRLVDLLGPAATKYLIFTADLIGAERARHIGLVDEILPDSVVGDRALRLAHEIANRSQLTIQATKDLVAQMVAGTYTAERGQAWADEVAASPDVEEGITAFRERRRPVFTWNGAGLPAHRG